MINNINSINGDKLLTNRLTKNILTQKAQKVDLEKISVSGKDKIWYL